MHITKWELLLLLQINKRDIANLCMVIAGERDPVNIDIFSIFFVLVATQPSLTMIEDKLVKIFQMMVFEVEYEPDGKKIDGPVTLDELRYVFQIGYQVLN